MKKVVFLLLYYGFAQYLPATNNGLKWSKIIQWIRRKLAEPAFEHCGKNVNIERKANFGKGIGIRIGDNSGLGVNCSVRGPLDMGANIMMGPDVTILTSIHNTVSTDIPMNQQGGRPIKR